MDQPSLTKWSGTLEKCSPIHQEEEARQTETRDPPTLDPTPLSHTEAEITLRIGAVITLGLRAHLMLTIIILIKNQAPPLSPPIKEIRGPHRHYNPHLTRASLVETGGDLGHAPEVGHRREAVGPPATLTALLEDKGAPEVAATVVTGGVLENLYHTR